MLFLINNNKDGKKMKTKIHLLAFLAAVSLAAGCSQQNLDQKSKPIVLKNATRADAITASEMVLKDMQFSIDKMDRQLGYIKTKPLQGSQVFEFWKSDSVGAYNTAESNIHTVRRTIELQIQEENQQMYLVCKADTERLSLSQPVDSASSVKYDKFGDRQRKSGTVKIKMPTKDSEWVYLGQDPMLENAVLERIEKKISKVK
jgi:hypothetical protein